MRHLTGKNTLHSDNNYGRNIGGAESSVFESFSLICSDTVILYEKIKYFISISWIKTININGYIAIGSLYTYIQSRTSTLYRYI